MVQNKWVCCDEKTYGEVGYELAEEELATICAGRGEAGAPNGADLGSYYGFPNLDNLLNSQIPAPKNGAVPAGTSTNGLPSFNGFGGPLSTLAGGLLGKII